LLGLGVVVSILIRGTERICRDEMTGVKINENGTGTFWPLYKLETRYLL